jgi:phosphatidate cytidylyltransferase
VLRQRVITALVLLPLVLVPIVWLPTVWMYAVYCGFGLLAAWEWTTLMGLSRSGPRIAYVALIAVAFVLAWIVTMNAGGAIWILAPAMLWWLAAAAHLPGFPGNVQRRPWNATVLGTAGLFALVPAILALALLKDAAPHGVRIGLLFLLVWAADIGAYFAGRAFGRHKLAPNISPGKTIEGALGGFLLSMAMLALAPWVFQGPLPWLWLMLLAVLVVIASIVGDLTESLFKRLRGIKDSGTLLPGHGGVLDRVDSLLAAAPVFALGLILIGL